MHRFMKTLFMKRLSFSILLLASCLSARASSVYFGFMDKTVMVADSADAALMVATSDNYTSSLSPFDLKARLGGENKAERDYLSASAREVRSWTQREKEDMKTQLAALESMLKGFGLKFLLPDTVRMIKSTMANEFGAEGYTRRSMVILSSEQTTGISVHLLAHELFHVFSRYNPGMRDAIYASIGFKKCNRINYNTAIGGQAITNPDCPVIEHYTNIAIGDANEDVALIIYSAAPYREGARLEEMVSIGLLALDGDDAHKKPKMKDGKAVIYTLEQGIALYGKVGRNTPYMIHPEEISAEHFAKMVHSTKVMDPDKLEAIKEVLKN
jgi:hypothetical protein